MLISGVAKDTDVARISVMGVPNIPGLAFKMFSKLSAKDINVDIILQSIGSLTARRTSALQLPRTEAKRLLLL